MDLNYDEFYHYPTILSIALLMLTARFNPKDTTSYVVVMHAHLLALFYVKNHHHYVHVALEI
jgi:hypothetical protein